MKKQTNEIKLDDTLEKNESVFVAHKSQDAHESQHEADMLMDALIADICANDPCAAQKLLEKGEQQYNVEFLVKNLPAVTYVGQFYLELIIHGGLVAENESNQKKLDRWVESFNPLGQSNGNVIRNALYSSIVYGYSGLRDVLGDLLYIAPNHFRIWELPLTTSTGLPIPGVRRPIFYEVNTDKDLGIESKENHRNVFTIDGKEYTLAEVVKQNLLKKGPDGSFYQDDQEDGASVKQVYLPSSIFCHLRHTDDGKYGISPLTSDRLRTTLIVDYLKNVIDEVNNDGTDYMMYLKQRGIVGSSLASTLSVQQGNSTVNAAMETKQNKTIKERQLGAARDLAHKLKRTAKTRIGIVSEDWVDKVEKLQGTVDLNNYLTVLNDAKGVIADIYGIPAMLAGSSGGGWSTGMSALIPFTLERTIKPFQQRYAEQLSPMIAKCAGVNGRIHFKELNWEDEKTRAEIDKLKAETEKLLAEANKAAADKAKVSKETKLLTSDGVNGKSQTDSGKSNPKTTTTAKKSTVKK